MTVCRSSSSHSHHLPSGCGAWAVWLLVQTSWFPKDVVTWAKYQSIHSVSCFLMFLWIKEMAYSWGSGPLTLWIQPWARLLWSSLLSLRGEDGRAQWKTCPCSFLLSGPEVPASAALCSSDLSLTLLLPCSLAPLSQPVSCPVPWPHLPVSSLLIVLVFRPHPGPPSFWISLPWVNTVQSGQNRAWGSLVLALQQELAQTAHVSKGEWAGFDRVREWKENFSGPVLPGLLCWEFQSWPFPKSFSWL